MANNCEDNSTRMAIFELLLQAGALNTETVVRHAAAANMNQVLADEEFDVNALWESNGGGAGLRELLKKDLAGFPLGVPSEEEVDPNEEPAPSGWKKDGKDDKNKSTAWFPGKVSFCELAGGILEQLKDPGARSEVLDVFLTFTDAKDEMPLVIPGLADSAFTSAVEDGRCDWPASPAPS